MNIHFISLVFLCSVSSPAWAGNEGMANMPKIKPTKSYAIKNGADLENQRGFGDEEPMTKMMNLMMVEGSGMEGMDMGAMKMADNKHENHSMVMPSTTDTKATGDKLAYEIEVVTMPSSFKVGANNIQFSVKEKQKKTTGLKLESQVFMTSMDMGMETPVVKEVSAGIYQVKAPFAMKGPWAVKLIFPNKQEKVFNFDVQSK